VVSQARLLRQRRALARCRASRAAGASPLTMVRVGQAWRFEERASVVGKKTSRALGRHGGGLLCADIVQPPPARQPRNARGRRHGLGALWYLGHQGSAGSWSCACLPRLSGAAAAAQPAAGARSRAAITRDACVM